MAYFDYRIDTHLFRPTTITTNITYNGQTCQTVAQYVGQNIHDNFFNLAKSATDNTTRIVVLEGKEQSALSSNEGYLSYSGKEERDGYLYGGTPLVLSGTTVVGTDSSFSYVLNSSASKAFRVAVGDGIHYTESGEVDLNTSIFREFIFGEVAGGPYTSASLLTTYLNSKLKYETKGGTNNFYLTGSSNPVSQTSDWWNARFGALATSPKSFYIMLDESGTGQKVTLGTNISQTWSALTTAISGAVSAATQLALTVSNTGTAIRFTGNTDRLNGGVFHFKLVKDPEDTGDSILEWLGIITNPDTSKEAYDFSSVIQFTPREDTAPVDDTWYIDITGQQSYSNIALLDKDSSDLVNGILSGFGISGASSTIPLIVYHTRNPLVSYNTRLNYGGELFVNKLIAQDISFSSSSAFDSSTFSGVSTFSGNIVGQAIISATGNINTDSTFNGVNSVISGTSTTGVLSVTGDATIGDSSSDTLIINSTSTINGNVSILNSKNLTVGAVSVTGASGAISATSISSTSLSASTANITSASIGTLTSALSIGSTLSTTGNVTVGGYLNITGISSANGVFYKGTTNPADTTRVNYNGDLWATKFSFTDTATGTGTGLVVSGNTIIRTSSDIRMKENILPIDYDITTINKLKPVSFTWKDVFLANKEEIGKRSIGFIAQELREVVPEAVFGKEDQYTYLGVNYDYLVPVLVKAVQQLSSQVEQLTKRVEILESK